MKAIFIGGPWHGVEINVPVLPRSIALGDLAWANVRNIDNAYLLADWQDHVYLLKEHPTLPYYRLIAIVDP